MYPLWVSPSEIDYVISGSSLPTSSIVNLDRKLGGDWDTNIIQVDSPVGDLGLLEAGLVAIEYTDIHQAFVQHFLHDKDWTDTDFFKRVDDQISSGKRKWRCSTTSELLKRLEGVDTLYRILKEQGYKTQIELHTPRYWDEVRLGVGRDGKAHLFDGRHRLSLAKILGIEKIPVFICLRHTQWAGDLATLQQRFGKK
jgi:hypothetical protein